MVNKHSVSAFVSVSLFSLHIYVYHNTLLVTFKIRSYHWQLSCSITKIVICLWQHNLMFHVWGQKICFDQTWWMPWCQICHSWWHHDDVIKWKHFLWYWPFVQGIHRSPHKVQWRAALMFSLICAWINGWVNNHEAGDLRHHRAHYDVTVMTAGCLDDNPWSFLRWCGQKVIIMKTFEFLCSHTPTTTNQQDDTVKFHYMNHFCKIYIWPSGINSLVPGRFQRNFQMSNFPANFGLWWLRYLF